MQVSILTLPFFLFTESNNRYEGTVVKVCLGTVAIPNDENV